MLRTLSTPRFAGTISALAISLAACFAAPAQADAISVFVDISDQRMKVYDGNRLMGDWPVSTARPGKRTPLGTYSPQFLSRNHRSSLYNNAPMPFSIFFNGNYAIHGTDQISRLGNPASAGCVRLHPDNAAKLFSWVQEAGMDATAITVRQ